MGFKKIVKNTVFGFFLVVLVVTIFESQSIALKNTTIKISSNKILNSTTDVPTKNTSIAFHVVDDNLIKQFNALITQKKENVQKEYVNLIQQKRQLYEIFQTYAENSFSWWKFNTWELPIDFKVQWSHIPVFRSEIDELALNKSIDLLQYGDHVADNNYLYGDFNIDEYDGQDSWKKPVVYNAMNFILSNMYYKNNRNTDLFGFGQLEMKTQDWQKAYKKDMIDLNQIYNHQFGTDKIDTYYFPESGKIVAWDDNDDGCKAFTFKSLTNNNLVPLLYDAAFSSRFSRIWSQSIQNWVSKNVLYVVDKQKTESNFANTFPFLNIDQLFQLDELGYDYASNQYWYSVNFNKQMLLGVLGKYYNEDLKQLFSTDMYNNTNSLNLWNFHYWNNLKDSNLKVVNGGKYSWVDKAKLPKITVDEYNENMRKLIDFLTECIDKEILTYDNYFYVKSQINQFVEQNQIFPPNEWIYDQFNKQALWKDNGWVKIAQKNNFTSQSISLLALLLPKINYSQFSMFDTTGLGQQGWMNSEQCWNVGTQGMYNHRFFTFDDIINHRNKVWINPTSLPTNEPIKIMFNVGIDQQLQTEKSFMFKDNFAEENDPITDGKYLSCNTENHQMIANETQHNISLQKNSTFINHEGKMINNFDYYEIVRDGKKIIETNNLLNKSISVNEQLKSHLASEVWSDAQKRFPNNTVAALKSIFHDQNNLPASPFANVDIWTKEFIDYDIPSNQLEVKVNDLTGSMTIHIVNTTQSVQVSGFKIAQTSESTTDKDHQLPDENNPSAIGGNTGENNGDVPDDQELSDNALNTRKIIIISSGSLGGASLATLATFWLTKKIIKKRKNNDKSGL